MESEDMGIVWTTKTRRRRRRRREVEEKIQLYFVCCVCTCIPHKGVMSLHSCYRHLTGLHFPGMRYVVVLWPDPKTPATDSAPVDQRLKSMARDEVSICLPRHKWIHLPIACTNLRVSGDCRIFIVLDHCKMPWRSLYTMYIYVMCVFNMVFCVCRMNKLMSHMSFFQIFHFETCFCDSVEAWAWWCDHTWSH